MRFTHPPGNPTAVLDRAEGRLYHLAGVNARPGDKEGQQVSPTQEAQLLLELLNTMHGRIISLSVTLEGSQVVIYGDDFSERKIQPAGMRCYAYDCPSNRKNICMSLTSQEAMEQDCINYRKEPV